jgi:predicted AAA+ superfamily ATPase
MKRQIKSPKVYLRDSGILHSLLDVPSIDALFAHPKLGASWEGFVIEQICCAAPRSRAYFWATHTGAELDLLLLHKGRRMGFECKVADSPKATKSMHIALQDLSLDEILVISPRAGTYPLAPKITACGLGEAIALLRG